MFDTQVPRAPKLPLDEAGAAAIDRLGRWLRVVGSIQLGLSGIFLFVMGLQLMCSFAFAGLAALLMLIPLVMAAVYLLQALRTQAAGEQMKNLAEDHDVDYLELAFVRLKTVFIIDIVIGVLSAIGKFQ